MPGPIMIDTNESNDHETALRICATVERVPLNVHNFADYLWHDWNDSIVQLEHKQIGEILGGLDHVEEQLSRQLPKADRNYLIWTGEFEPLTNNTCQEYRKHGKVYIPGHVYKRAFSGVIAWFDQLDQCGITVSHVSREEDLPMALVSLYNSHQVSPDGHHTLKRYIKDKIHIEDKNPHISMLLAIKRIGLGEEGARNLIERYGTIWQVFNQEASQLALTDGVSINTANKLLKAIGR